MFNIKKLSDNSKEFLNTYYSIIDQAKNDIINISMGTNLTSVLIDQLIVLYQSAIKMSENILNYTTDADVEDFAKNLIANYTQTVEDLQSIKQKCENIYCNEIDMKLYSRKALSMFNTLVNNLNGTLASNNLNAIYLNAIHTHTKALIELITMALPLQMCDILKDYLTKHLQSLSELLNNLKSFKM